MTFGTTLRDHHTMAASAKMFYITIDYNNKANMKVAASNINIKMDGSAVFWTVDSWCPRGHYLAENLSGLDINLLTIILVKITIKLIFFVFNVFK